MTEIYNVDNMPDDYIDDPRFESGLKTKLLGALGGSEKIYINIDSNRGRRAYSTIPTHCKRSFS